jgi:hypothetical protein
MIKAKGKEQLRHPKQVNPGPHSTSRAAKIWCSHFAGGRCQMQVHSHIWYARRLCTLHRCGANPTLLRCKVQQ